MHPLLEAVLTLATAPALTRKLLAPARRTPNNLCLQLFVALLFFGLCPTSQQHTNTGPNPRSSARTNALLARRRLVHPTAPWCKTALLHLSSRGFPALGTPVLLGCICPNSVLCYSISHKAERGLDLHHFNYRVWLLNSPEQNTVREEINTNI